MIDLTLLLSPRKTQMMMSLTWMLELMRRSSASRWWTRASADFARRRRMASAMSQRCFTTCGLLEEVNVTSFGSFLNKWSLTRL